jgi:hypothetical protein
MPSVPDDVNSADSADLADSPGASAGDGGGGGESVARRMWRLFEPVHAVTYFAPQAIDAYAAAGLTGFWRGYFAGRAAPLGPVAAPPVVACFFGFAPTMVARALPGVWSRISPERALAARLDGARAALEPAVAGIPDAAIGRVAELMRAVAEHVDVPGRVLAAANAALPWPSDPLDTLWHATTILREHRGDGHVAALVTAGLDGAEVAVWRTSLGAAIGRADYQNVRGWSDDDWTAATERLRARGWLDDDDAPTERALLAEHSIEATTDHLAQPAWATLGPKAVAECVATLTPIAVRAADVMRWPNPIGVPDPRQAVAGRAAHPAHPAHRTATGAP